MTKSPEPLILGGALALLALVAAGLAYEFPKAEDLTGVVSTIPTNKNPLKKLKEEDLQASLAIWTKPVLWDTPEGKHRLFISDDFLFYATLYPTGNYIQKNDGSARTPGGVLISWYQTKGLDFTDPNIDRTDSDGDGFSNKTEFMNEIAKAADSDGSKATNPIDPQSHPTFLSRLRVAKYNSRPFHVKFMGYQDLNGQKLFQLFLKDVPSSKQPGLKKTGDPLGVEGYIVGEFKQNIVDEVDPATKLKSPVDRSTLELDKPDIGLKIVVPFRQEIDSPESTADFAMLMPSEVNKVIRVPAGKTFTLPLTNDTYLVLNVGPNGATIRDVKTKKEFTIPKLGPDEWNDVPQAGSAPAAAAAPAGASATNSAPASPAPEAK